MRRMIKDLIRGLKNIVWMKCGRKEGYLAGLNFGLSIMIMPKPSPQNPEGILIPHLFYFEAAWNWSWSKPYFYKLISFNKKPVEV